MLASSEESALELGGAVAEELVHLLFREQSYSLRSVWRLQLNADMLGRLGLSALDQ